MRLYLAGAEGAQHELAALETPPPYLLATYYTLRNDPTTASWLTEYVDHRGVRDLMCDSGAFTFLQGSAQTPPGGWEAYVDDYATFVREHNIEHYFELDIDNVVGLERVRQYRDRLERRVGWPPIPVWHKSRGKGAYLALCEAYDYVAVGGIAGGEITRDEANRLVGWFTNTAHDHDAHLHFLGWSPPNRLTRTNPLPDSADSISWRGGSRFKMTYRFTGTELTYHQPGRKDPDRPLADADQLNKHNLREWVKLAQHLDTP